MAKKVKEVRVIEATKSRVTEELVEYFKVSQARDPLRVVAALAGVSQRTARKQLAKAGALR